MSKIVTVKNLHIGENKPKICIPLCESSPDKLAEEALHALAQGAQLLEWRADCFADPANKRSLLSALAALRAACPNTPLLATFRSSFEGGFFAAGPKAYRDITCTIIESGMADIIDLELFTVPGELADLVSLARARGVKVLLSNHDFKATMAPSEMITILRNMEAAGGDIYKLAAMPQSFADVLSLMETVYSYTRDEYKNPVAAISMGRLGSVSRLCGEHYGSCLTYAAARHSSAPGQLSAQLVRHFFGEA